MARMQGLALPSGNRSLLIIAALAGLAAAVLFVVAVNNGDSKSNAGGTTGVGGNTVVALKDIRKGYKIEADAVKIATASAELRVTNALDDTAKVVGQYATNDITAGEQITAARIGTSAPIDCGLSCGLELGTVATSLQVKEVTAVGGLLYAGNRVNVIGAFKIKNDGSVKDCSGVNILRTQTILQNVRVLSVAQEQQKASETASDPKQQPGAATITLALTPEDSQVLISAQERAKTVWTSLRSNGDTEIREIPPLNECSND